LSPVDFEAAGGRLAPLKGNASHPSLDIDSRESIDRENTITSRWSVASLPLGLRTKSNQVFPGEDGHDSSRSSTFGHRRSQAFQMNCPRQTFQRTTVAWR